MSSPQKWPFEADLLRFRTGANQYLYISMKALQEGGKTRVVTTFSSPCGPNSRLQRDSTMANLRLKAQLRPESDFPIIMSSVHENDFVSDFQAQAERTQESLDSASWIES